MAQKSTCSGCGKAIVWAESDNGPIPLDPAPAVYEVVEEPLKSPIAKRSKTAMVLHFVTCPKANQFSKGGPDVSVRGERM